MTAELEGKVGLVTGGTSGIGREAALLFAKAGAKVVVAGRREKEGRETIELIEAAAGEGLFVRTDVSKASEVDALIQKAVEKFGRLDVAFNNAGIEGVWVPIVRQSEEDWDRIIETNLTGTMRGCQIFGKPMLSRGYGRIINSFCSLWTRTR